ncbi:hypothetical protein [Natronomonas marina]|jgi:hypothetical protein|uniref:hypothetical protein n=1 Tax=Natronomonas marina TaxID=2961939 RepID=UPI0020C993E4|nr:hypothetical protein [Natronomonas marina]
MDETAVRKLRFLALQVVGAVAVVHLVVGVAELLRFASGGLLVEYFTTQALAQPEPWLFTLSALAILGGVLAVGFGHLGYRRAYLLGAAAMATFVVGWLAWHSVLGHGVGEATAADASHRGLLDVVGSHYVDPLVGIFTGADQPGRTTLAVVSKTLEVVALALLGTLLFVDPRVESEEPDNPVAAMGEEAAEE